MRGGKKKRKGYDWCQKKKPGGEVNTRKKERVANKKGGPIKKCGHPTKKKLAGGGKCTAGNDEGSLLAEMNVIERGGRKEKRTKKEGFQKCPNKNGGDVFLTGGKDAGGARGDGKRV